MRFDFRNPPRALVIVLLAILCVGVGFLADFGITCIEKATHPCDYAEYVEVYAEQYGVTEAMAYAVIRSESDFESGAVSPAGAIGLMQLMPDTFRWLTDEMLFEHLEDGMIYDPETNIRYGLYYLSYLYDRFGDWQLALAAYNAGPGSVSEWLADPEYADGEGGLEKIPYRETRRYVKRVNRAWKTYDRLYGEEWEETETATDTTADGAISP